MNNGSPVCTFFFIAAILLLVLFFRKSDPEAKRRKDLAALAQKLHLRFSPNNDFKTAEKFSFLTWLRRGDVRYAYNVFHGCHLEYPVTIFDYHFSTPGSGKSGGYDYYWSAFIVEMKTNLPDMIISHESWESRLVETLGESHVTFESAAFSRTFRVRSSDKKFAYDVCHPKMMEYLLANQDLTVEISGAGLAVLFEDWLRPEKIEANLSRLIEIRKLLPNYLFAKTGAGTGIEA
jgi:hypothetical protein